MPEQSSLFNANDIPMGIPLSHFTAAITHVVNTSRELSGAWVMAELSDVRIAGGHCYMELIEKNDAGTTIAKLRATIWQSNFNNIRRKFFQATQKDIVTGLKVLIRGSVSHHSVYGLSFNITDIDPSYTLGDMERVRREILQRLAKEQVINLNKNRFLPPTPQRIAVISAEGAAGYGDFMNQLIGNQDGFVFYPCLFPCVMQGDRVSASIREALELIESTIDLWDCVVIIRGGGATTDMNGFDDYDLAYAVATVPLPVIVGIGHERDRNVLDEIAHISVKTPTAVATFFIDRLRMAYDAVISMADRIRQTAVDKLRGEDRRLATIESLVPQCALRRLSENRSKLQELSGRLPLLVSGRIGKENMKLTGRWEMIASLSSTHISRGTQRINNFEQLLKVLDPSNTLKRGYSITRVDGKSVKNADNLSSGTLLTTKFYNGEIKSRVEK